ncbi:FAD-dependent monooxygenase [Streptomyces sp. H27-S2]|uniref:FAD-dependent monooxygenase n=1 Tax=Streptomyces antarcticus TaxID=2996458 RepID=UPI0022713FA7|nr:FAD-dependent monooxygenase [Streptomyces sp. H27-S2]MCY0950472.1 FAD-dependent monooxygenase [Streptomyces sp. H27-S2]
METDTTDTDVLVVGAGPTGLFLAAELALAGVRTRVVERRTEPQRDSRALNLHPRSLELMDQRGLADRFLALGRTVPGWQFAATLRTPLDFSALPSRHPHALLLAQSRTEALLEERARELGVEIHRGHEVTALRQNAEGIEADIHGPDGPATIRAAYAAGCDGARSLVRQTAGIAFPGTDESFTAMVGDFTAVDHKDIDQARRHGVLVARLEPNLTRFVVMDPERMRVPSTEPVTPDEFHTALVRVCGTTCGTGRPTWLSRFGNATRLAERYRSGRLLLAGDAAHIHFPVGAQGLNTGLQDAMNLGWKLAAEIQGWATPGLLDTYHTERHPVGRAVTERTEAQTLLVELPLVERYRRPATLLCKLLDDLLGLDEVNRRLAGHLSAIDTAYPPADQAAHPLTGRRMPDTTLTLPGGRQTRPSELQHDGRFALLHLRDTTAPHTLAPPIQSLMPPGPVKAVNATADEKDTGLNGITEVLIRPDGHVAWATSTTDPRALATERSLAFDMWIRTPS